VSFAAISVSNFVCMCFATYNMLCGCVCFFLQFWCDLNCYFCCNLVCDFFSNLVYNFLLLCVQFYSFFYILVCDFLFSRVQFYVFLQFGVCDFVFFVAISCVYYFFPQ
jgi:hypothetical protein